MFVINDKTEACNSLSEPPRKPNMFIMEKGLQDLNKRLYENVGILRMQMVTGYTLENQKEDTAKSSERPGIMESFDLELCKLADTITLLEDTMTDMFGPTK